MKSNTLFFLFFIIGGFVTAAVGVAYFASGESSRAPEAQNYMVLLQIPLGAFVTLYGIRHATDRKQND
jgi:hypothetical protein